MGGFARSGDSAALAPAMPVTISSAVKISGRHLKVMKSNVSQTYIGVNNRGVLNFVLSFF